MTDKTVSLTRRGFLGGSLMAAAGCMAGQGAMPRHRSDYDGVQIGVITYSYRSMPKAPDATLGYVTGSGLGTIELMGGDLERDAGMPFADRATKSLTADEKAAIAAWPTGRPTTASRSPRRWVRGPSPAKSPIRRTWGSGRLRR